MKNQPGCPINLEPLQLKDVLNQGLNLLEATKALKSEWISRSLFYEVTFAFLDVIFRLFLGKTSYVDNPDLILKYSFCPRSLFVYNLFQNRKYSDPDILYSQFSNGRRIFFPDLSSTLRRTKIDQCLRRRERGASKILHKNVYVN